MPDPVTGPPGMRCELLVERETRCRRAKSVRWYGLREAVYTVSAGALSTGLAGRVGGAAVNWGDAMGAGDRGRDADLGVPGPRRQRPPGLAAAAAPGGGANLRRSDTGLEPRSPRRRPGGQARPAGVCGGRGNRGVRRHAGWPAGGVAGPSGWLAHQL